MNKSSALVWFRRDLRCADHAALHHALQQHAQVHCVFVYDTEILDALPRRDRRVVFIHACVAELDASLRAMGGGLRVLHARADHAIPHLARELGVAAVYCNHDYEPAAMARDSSVAATLQAEGRALHTFKDQVIFEKDEVLSQGGTPFSVFTPYKNAWLRRLHAEPAALDPWPVTELAQRLAPAPLALPTLADLGFEELPLPLAAGMSGAAALFEDFESRIADYGVQRDYPAIKGPSYLSVHLRFGTCSIRHLVRSAFHAAGPGAATWLSELIWREFYMMILYQNPHVVDHAFRPAYDAITWESGPEADERFTAWCEGRTGYPLVDAAMHQLNQTGYMHNRLRMVTASFLVKDLGIDWRWGERYFAQQLNDFDLSANNGGWQWAASTGCDAQPYFRIFNPVTQSEKFDPEGRFIKRYLPELEDLNAKTIHAPWKIGRYLPPIVDHDAARQRTLARFAVLKQPAPADR